MPFPQNVPFFKKNRFDALTADCIAMVGITVKLAAKYYYTNLTYQYQARKFNTYMYYTSWFLYATFMLRFVLIFLKKGANLLNDSSGIIFHI